MIMSFNGEYDFLSNFYPVSITYEGMVFPSLEHAYQAAKTLDMDERRKIQQQARPGQAKRLGKRVKLRIDWDERKLRVMFDLVMQKFSIGELRAKLLATGTEELVEGNSHGDRFWGVCHGNGENHLGKTLMMVRRHLSGKEVKSAENQ